MTNKVCRVVLSGGLGNQLFKFANALRVSKEFNRALILDLTFYDYVSRVRTFATPRNFELDYFPNVFSIQKTTRRSQLGYRVFSKLMRESPAFVRNLFGYFVEGSDILESLRGLSKN
jgi:hypothetical protein